MHAAREELFRALIEEHGAHPRHDTALEHADARAVGHNPMCGDRVTVSLRTDADSDSIAACACHTKGCAICTASASVLTGLVQGLTRAEATALFNAFRDACVSGAPMADTPMLNADARETLEALTVIHQSPLRVKCVTLPWHTLQAALTGAGEKTRDLHVSYTHETSA